MLFYPTTMMMEEACGCFLFGDGRREVDRGLQTAPDGRNQCEEQQQRDATVGKDLAEKPTPISSVGHLDKCGYRSV